MWGNFATLKFSIECFVRSTCPQHWPCRMQIKCLVLHKQSACYSTLLLYKRRGKGSQGIWHTKKGHPKRPKSSSDPGYLACLAKLRRPSVARTPALLCCVGFFPSPHLPTNSLSLLRRSGLLRRVPSLGVCEARTDWRVGRWSDNMLDVSWCPITYIYIYLRGGRCDLRCGEVSCCVMWGSAVQCRVIGVWSVVGRNTPF